MVLPAELLSYEAPAKAELNLKTTFSTLGSQASTPPRCSRMGHACKQMHAVPCRVGDPRQLMPPGLPACVLVCLRRAGSRWPSSSLASCSWSSTSWAVSAAAAGCCRRLLAPSSRPAADVPPAPTCCPLPRPPIHLTADLVMNMVLALCVIFKVSRCVGRSVGLTGAHSLCMCPSAPAPRHGTASASNSALQQRVPTNADHHGQERARRLWQQRPDDRRGCVLGVAVPLSAASCLQGNRG